LPLLKDYFLEDGSGGGKSKTYQVQVKSIKVGALN
jgi:hypothetical protein